MTIFEQSILLLIVIYMCICSYEWEKCSQVTGLSMYSAGMVPVLYGHWRFLLEGGKHGLGHAVKLKLFGGEGG